MIEISFTHLAIMAVIVGVILLLLWPTVRGGQRLLRNWGVLGATPEQGMAAKRYLLIRRLLYVVFAVVLGLIISSYTGNDNSPLSSMSYVGAVLLGLLLAELVAALRPVRGGTRVATLSPRTWRSLVTRWSVAAHLVVAVLAIVSSVMVLAAQPWFTEASSVIEYKGSHGLQPIAVIVIVALSVIAVYGLVRLAVIRPAVGDLQVDAALRIRSARVMVGIGTMVCAQLISAQLLWLSQINHSELRGYQGKPDWLDWVGTWSGAASWIVLLAGAVTWILITNPLRKPAVRTALA